MLLKAGIFDMDGVIVDTVPLHFKSWQRVFQEHGVDLGFDDYKQKVDGIPRVDGARAILPHLSEEDIQKVCGRKQEFFVEAIESDTIPRYETTLSLIEEMRKDGVKVSVISSSKNCRRILTQVGVIDLLDAVVDGYEVTRGKPNPQVFELAAKRLQVEYRCCVGVEDAVLGVEAVKRAGMFCVGIDRYQEPERLAKADVVVGDLGELSYAKLKELVR